MAVKSGSKKKVTKRKAPVRKKAGRKSTLTESAKLIDSNGTEWAVVGKLSKADFKMTSKISPADTFHDRIVALDSSITDISEIGVSRATNGFFEKQLTAFAKKKYPGISDLKLRSSVGMAMLNLSPCDVEGAEDFVLYKRPWNRKGTSA